jgi:hypothetical protein
MTGARRPGQSRDRRALSTMVVGVVALVLLMSLVVGVMLPRSSGTPTASTTTSTFVSPTATAVSSTEASSSRADGSSTTSSSEVTSSSSTTSSSTSTTTSSETETTTPETTTPEPSSTTTTTKVSSTSSSATASTSTSSSSAAGQWVSGPDYPTNESGSCAASGGYVYCIGGETDAVYYAPLSSSGVGPWTATTAYPTSISGQSCVASEGYVYCVSGLDGTEGPRPTSAVYYAPASQSGGLGAWVGTTGYPVGALGLSCAATTGYVFCVGGANTVGSLESNATYFAPISSAGVGAWAATTSYPTTVDDESCVTSGGFIDCIGGYTALGPRAINSTYYAPISSAGIGAWTAGAAYPIADSGLSCVTVGNSAYCIGGETGSGDATDAVYSAQLSASGGIGAWGSAASYPIDVITSCVAEGSTVACVAGSTGAEGPTAAVYYASFS